MERHAEAELLLGRSFGLGGPHVLVHRVCFPFGMGSKLSHQDTADFSLSVSIDQGSVFNTSFLIHSRLTVEPS